MEALKGSERRYLRSQGHGLKPTVFVGKAGLTDAVLASIEQALLAHELVKVRFVDHKEARKELAVAIAERSGSALAGMVGHVALFYRPHPDPQKRRIVLPRRAPGS